MKVKAALIQHQSPEQIHWGGNDNPNELLEIGKFYECEIEVRSSSTKLYLKAFPDKVFSSGKFTFDPPDAWEQAAEQWRQDRNARIPKNYKERNGRGGFMQFSDEVYKAPEIR